MFCNNVTRFQMYGCCIRLWTSSKFAGYILHLWGCIRQMVRLLFSLLAVFVTLCVLVLTPVSINYLMFFWLITLIEPFCLLLAKMKEWVLKIEWIKSFTVFFVSVGAVCFWWNFWRSLSVLESLLQKQNLEEAYCCIGFNSHVPHTGVCPGLPFYNSILNVINK